MKFTNMIKNKDTRTLIDALGTSNTRRIMFVAIGSAIGLHAKGVIIGENESIKQVINTKEIQDQINNDLDVINNIAPINIDYVESVARNVLIMRMKLINPSSDPSVSLGVLNGIAGALREEELDIIKDDMDTYNKLIGIVLDILSDDKEDNDD